jgi:hypothetical protein
MSEDELEAIEEQYWRAQDGANDEAGADSEDEG